MTKSYWVYILTNKISTVLYVGVTNNLIKRIWQHKNGKGSIFTSKYQVTKLVYSEKYQNINLALAREKQLKAGSRKKKLDLVLKFNPTFEDLYFKLFK